MQKTEMPEKFKKCAIRRRTKNEGSVSRPRKITVRVTVGVSNKTASIQGLCRRWGKRETLAELYESVMLPALAEYVRPYADKAKAAREAAKGGAE